VWCSTYADSAPILDIAAGSSSVAISLRGSTAGKSAVEFARELADQARLFADEVERLHAARLDGIKAAGSDAA
jgi:hypothetical protein